MNELLVKIFPGQQDYVGTWQAMKDFIARRDADTPDELWLLEHPPVFTQGLAGKPEHVLNAHHIPVIQTDRGGQITYHGPGQLMAYLLFDINRLGMKTRPFVRTIEQTVINYLASLTITATGKIDAPGIYVNDAKIGSIGLRVRKGFSYHGLALNIKMDLTPFSYINPCGFKGLNVTQLADLNHHTDMNITRRDIVSYFLRNFGYNQARYFEPVSLELQTQ